MSQPRNAQVISHLREVSGYDIQPLVAGDAEIAEAVERYYGRKKDDAEGLHLAAMPDLFDPDDIG